MKILTELKKEPYEICTAESGKDGMSLLQERPFKLVISDERMPQMSGTEFLSLVKKDFPDTVRIMLTGHASISAAISAVNNGEIYRFFLKPWDDIELKMSIKSGIDKYNLEDENRRLLKTIKSQVLEIKILERQFPGISRLEHDDAGNLIVPETSKAELENLFRECELEVQRKIK